MSIQLSTGGSSVVVKTEADISDVTECSSDGETTIESSFEINTGTNGCSNDITEYPRDDKPCLSINHLSHSEENWCPCKISVRNITIVGLS